MLERESVELGTTEGRESTRYSHDVLKEESDADTKEDLEAEEVARMRRHVRPVEQAAPESDQRRAADDKGFVATDLGDESAGDDDEDGLDDDHG
jgi:hypothetical protein